jgi:hypothetical protein
LGLDRFIGVQNAGDALPHIAATHYQQPWFAKSRW